MGEIRFLDDKGTFELNNAENYSYLYFPLACARGLKSSITPNLGGDSKIDQESFLLEPVSSENLHNNRSTRNFWCLVEGEKPWSAVGASAEAEDAKFTDEQDANTVTGGLMWHKVSRENAARSLRSEITSFVPVDANTEVMIVRVTNTADREVKMSAVAAIPVYGRSADNIRDHRNVTSMLHRIRTTEAGVIVKPTMSFDERGHRVNHTSYFVFGAEGNGNKPEGFYPTVSAYLGEGGSFTHPAAVFCKKAASWMAASGETFEGEEAVGAIRFREEILKPGQTRSFVVAMGIAQENENPESIFSAYRTEKEAEQALAETREYWKKAVNVDFHTGDIAYDNFLKWVSFQPFLRSLFGCSFLPHHDYGRGGRGWRDLWQDCLSLLIMDPGDVRGNIINNTAGIRVDGSNATIIGSRPGEFVADRNGIARVWMDHGVWPLKTILLYINQTGDLDILLEKVPYFKDGQAKRGTYHDASWSEDQGTLQRTEAGEIYKGTILEHLLLEHLTSFYEVGEHGMLRLRGADWNDAIDMADARGESVAFSCAYTGNLRDLAGILRRLHEEKGIDVVSVLSEMETLLQKEGAEKTETESFYQDRVIHTVSGKTMEYGVEELAGDLERMADELQDKIRSQEWITEDEKAGWFNSYYDNSGNMVERAGEDVRMMLTGQVFSVMSGIADKEQTAKICEAADRHLYRREIGGYRLNTNFNELKFDMGRMFGFAYGEKENGAVFSHMTIMYAYALYSRGFVREGYKALQSLADQAMNFDVSRIYPGVPEYFDAKGRGKYHYLTGAASWFLLTMVTLVYGVRGNLGKLEICPKLVKEQFDEKGIAKIHLTFGGKEITVSFSNPSGKDAGEYRVKAAACNGKALEVQEDRLVMAEDVFASLAESGNEIEIELG